MMLSWQMTNPPTTSTTSWWPCRPAETRYRRWTSMACAFGAWLGSRSARRWLWLCGWGRTSLPVVTLLTSNDELVWWNLFMFENVFRMTASLPHAVCGFKFQDYLRHVCCDTLPNNSFLTKLDHVLPAVQDLVCSTCSNFISKLAHRGPQQFVHFIEWWVQLRPWGW